MTQSSLINRVLKKMSAYNKKVTIILSHCNDSYIIKFFPNIIFMSHVGLVNKCFWADLRHLLY